MQLYALLDPTFWYLMLRALWLPLAAIFALGFVAGYVTARLVGAGFKTALTKLKFRFRSLARHCKP